MFQVCYVFFNFTDATNATNILLLRCFLDYYLFDGGSILPVLALDLQLGDTVLDMCAAPGGKALTILQTLMPRLLVVNDILESKLNKIKKILNQYVSNIYKEKNMLVIKQGDARTIDEQNVYNKVYILS